MQTLTDIRRLLESRGLAPRKALGQNFLIDHNLIRKLVDAAGVGPRDLVLEVGPGTGTLTEELLERGCRVVACELDPNLAGLLRDRFAGNDRFTLIEGDCLASKRELSHAAAEALGASPFTLVANLPYNAATPLMLTLLCDHSECRGLFVTIQREVADRLLARPGTRDFGPIAVVAQAVGEVNHIATLPPECFWPRPEVTSAMASVIPSVPRRFGSARSLADFCQAAFSQRRKQLGSVLGREGPWPEGVSPSLRAEQLSVDQFVALWRMRKKSSPHPPGDRVA